MIDTEWIEKFIAQQEKIRDRNEQNYQESGISRYDRASRKADDMIDLATMALNVSGIKDDNRLYRSALAECANRAISILHHGIDSDPQGVESLLRDLRAYGLTYKIVGDPWN